MDIFLIMILIFIIFLARIVIAWKNPRRRRVLPAPVAEDVAALRRAAEAEAARLAAEALREETAVRLAAEALREETAVRLAAEALREETAVRRDVIEALHRRVEELERELAMRAVQEV